MNSMSGFVVLCLVCYLFHPRLGFVRTAAAFQDLSSGFEAAHNFGQQPDEDSTLGQALSDASVDTKTNNDDENNNNNSSTQRDSSAGLLFAETKLLEMLAATRKKLAQLEPFQVRQCSEFNWTLGEAHNQMASLIELAGNEAAPINGDTSKLDPQMGELHEQMDSERQLRALNAYEALGASVALYFECLSQSAQFGLANQLDNLLPISLSMGTLSEFVEAALASPSNLPNWSMQPASDQRGAGQVGMQSSANETSDGSAIGLMQGLEAGAQEAFEQTQEFFGWH